MSSIIQVDNYIGGLFVPPTSESYIDVLNPAIPDQVIGHCAVSNEKDVKIAVECAKKALPAWSKMTIKARATIMMKFHSLIQQNAEELAKIIVLENGKNMTEAFADVAKGNETVEYSCSLPQLAQGQILRVSSQVTCQDRRVPVGVIASIVPFNFPLMVPMWTLPIAMVMGNTVICKPSEKVPLTMRRVAELSQEAGFPPGVFNLVNGMRESAEALIDHPDVKAVTFVGSSPVAEAVSTRCRALNKRCTSLGGAKNHLIALPDCEPETAAADICVSFAGCAGQRCMAASVLLLVGGETQDGLVSSIVELASNIEPGDKAGQMGPVIDNTSYKKIMGYIEEAEKCGAEILLDGRPWATKDECKGNWIGPTIIKHNQSSDKTMQEEVFGPVLSIYSVSSWEEAIVIENSNPFGNAASIYTTSGGNAEWFLERFRASMLGVNVGIPVPREPFSFGGLYGTKSKFGDMDITGDAAVEFFSNRIKITSKWPITQHQSRKRSIEAVTGDADHANFAGSM